MVPRIPLNSLNVFQVSLEDVSIRCGQLLFPQTILVTDTVTRTRTQPVAVLVLDAVTSIEYEYHFIEYEYDECETLLRFATSVIVNRDVVSPKKETLPCSFNQLSLRRQPRALQEIG
jgi:hypothetical protein